MAYMTKEELEEVEKDKERCKKLVKDVIDILNKNGIRMSVWGCGCCRSPEVKLEYKGDMIVDEVEFNFDMFVDE